jgi:hypothetical protein
VERVEPGRDAGELSTLNQFLDAQRASAAAKLAGLTDAQARTRSVPASALTPGGVVKHLIATERWWFSLDFAALDVPEPGGGNYTGDFETGPEDTVDALLDRYTAECAASRAAIDGAALDDVSRSSDVPAFTLRYALVHMIEETARHCGHLDLLRESIDGARGA